MCGIPNDLITKLAVVIAAHLRDDIRTTGLEQPVAEEVMLAGIPNRALVEWMSALSQPAANKPPGGLLWVLP
jgi:hypothetical protein